MFGTPIPRLLGHSIALLGVGAASLWASLSLQNELRFFSVFVLFALLWWGSVIAAGWARRLDRGSRPRRSPPPWLAPAALAAYVVAYPLGLGVWLWLAEDDALKNSGMVMPTSVLVAALLIAWIMALTRLVTGLAQLRTNRKLRGGTR